MKNSGDYTPPILTVDNVVFRLDPATGTQLEVLLIERSNEPFKGLYAIPGGYNAAGETTQQAQERILAAKGGLSRKDLAYVEQLYTFDTVARDPRGHAVSVTYMGLTNVQRISTTDMADKPRFVAQHNLPELAFDHDKIITYAYNRLRSKIAYTNVIFALLPDTFTLTQLQQAYEAIFGRLLDKRNFRKKFLALDMITKTDAQSSGSAHRPARLYKFKQRSLVTLERSFD